MNAGIFKHIVRSVFCACLFFFISFCAGCDSSDSDGSSSLITIDIPSENETVLAEKRDFYVIGYFDQKVENPGDIKIELFKGNNAAGTPVRTVQSHVDPFTGTTPVNSIDLDYNQCVNW